MKCRAFLHLVTGRADPGPILECPRTQSCLLRDVDVCSRLRSPVSCFHNVEASPFVTFTASATAVVQRLGQKSDHLPARPRLAANATDAIHHQPDGRQKRISVYLYTKINSISHDRRGSSRDECARRNNRISVRADSLGQYPRISPGNRAPF